VTFYRIEGEPPVCVAVECQAVPRGATFDWVDPRDACAAYPHKGYAPTEAMAWDWFVNRAKSAENDAREALRAAELRTNVALAARAANGPGEREATTAGGETKR
jgi:hypothetical protein